MPAEVPRSHRTRDVITQVAAAETAEIKNNIRNNNLGVDEYVIPSDSRNTQLPQHLKQLCMKILHTGNITFNANRLPVSKNGNASNFSPDFIRFLFLACMDEKMKSGTAGKLFFNQAELNRYCSSRQFTQRDYDDYYKIVSHNFYQMLAYVYERTINVSSDPNAAYSINDQVVNEINNSLSFWWKD